MAVWKIAKDEGSGTVCEWEKSAPQTEIRAIPQQLASRHLSEDEVVEQASGPCATRTSPVRGAWVSEP